MKAVYWQLMGLPGLFYVYAVFSRIGLPLEFHYLCNEYNVDLQFSFTLSI
jgi:hypothetical protein